MSTVPAKGSPLGVAQRFKERILHTYFVRCDMSLILLVVIASGVGASKLMLELGVHSLQVRYPLALFCSFVAFLLLIRVWIWYVFCRNIGGVDLTNVGDIEISGGGGGGPNPGSVHFGGGESGGGGASDSWEGDYPEATGHSFSAPRGAGGGGSGIDFDFGDDWAIILLVIALVLAIIGAGSYLIYVAPHILPEAAWQATLASGLARVAKPTRRESWLTCVLRSSIIPFAVVLIFVVAVACVAHSHCPGAVKLAESLYCTDR